MGPKTKKIQVFIIAAIKAHPRDLVRVVSKKFDISPQAVHKHLNSLIKRGQLLKQGATRNIAYSLPTLKPIREPGLENFSSSNSQTVASERWIFPVNPLLSEQDVWDENLKPRLNELNANVREIVEYGFTEMVNNVKDHSAAKTLFTSYDITDDILTIEVRDDGIGIFRKIREALGLPTLREAILHLSKGKLTTDHTRHTGEGIFFSSRVFDKYFLIANGLSYGRINTLADEDWLIGEEKNATVGTRVLMSIALTSGRTREEVFRHFTSPEDFSFSKTHVAIELGMNEGETYVSRSQAKRILSGLEKFRFIVLNFKRVNSVGQGFVDEIFRVFKNAHPEIKIEFINANDSVEFMIRRGVGV